MNQSPVPQKAKIKIMTFPDAIHEMIVGHKVTRLEWNDENEYGYMKDGFMTIHTKGKDHRWMVSDGDYLNNDWVIVNELN